MRVGWKMGINGFTCAIASIFRSTICTIKQRIYCLFCFLWQWILFPANLTTIWCWSRKVIFSIINLAEIFDWHSHLWLTAIFSIAFILALSSQIHCVIYLKWITKCFTCCWFKIQLSWYNTIDMLYCDRCN